MDKKININGIKKGKLIEGDCFKELSRIPSDSIDQIITDPPYGLSYFGSDWDKQVPPVVVWKECFRVLKPGGFAFIMSSPRQDVLGKMIMNLEKAGFYTRCTSLYWTYLTGFAHRYRSDLAVDKKLGVESKIIETKVQERVKFKLARELGGEGQFCDESRVEYHIKEANSKLGKKFKGGYTGFHPKPAVEVVLVVMKPLSEKSYVNQAIFNEKGMTFQDDCAIPFFNKKNELNKRGMSNLIVSDNALDQFENEIKFKDVKGNSFRFSLDAWAKYTLPHLFVAKPSPAEKDFGLEALPTCNINDRKLGQVGFNVPCKPRPSDRKNIHPTVKPLKLMAYFTVLGSRPGDIILDPYCGSGTTCVSAMLLGRKFIGIEKDTKFFEIAKERLINCRMVPMNEKESQVDKSSVHKLSEIESITLRCSDDIIDMQALPSAIDYALKTKEKKTMYKNYEILTVFTKKSSVNNSKEKNNVQDWADKGINISKGCSNNCLYCYAREESVRRHGNVYENWSNEQLNEKMIKKGWRLSSKRLMFPTTHDITPGTYDACETVLKKLLEAGNPVLVVSKPRPDLIEKLCNSLEPYKKLMMFRFTISARNNDILSFWEPNAPCYEDRLKALEIAHKKGFMTSISIEPMLDPSDISGLIESLRPFVTDSMWIGPVKMIRKRVRIDSDKIEQEVQKIQAGQTPEKLLEVYNLYKDDQLIKWKGYFRKVLKKLDIDVPEQNDDWRDRL